MIPRSRSVAAVLVITLLVAVAYGTWLDWEWKAMIGWKALVTYINPDPDDTTGKKDAVQVYAVIVAGVIASITAAVGLLNLRLTRKNLEQQRELEAQRGEQQRELAQGTALQAYYEQIGNLITEYDLLNTQRKEIRELARGQTLTVLNEVDGNGKVSLLTFLYGAGLIGAKNPAVLLLGANFLGANLRAANLREANLMEANLREADLGGATLLGAKLLGADLRAANLRGADLRHALLGAADLRGADLQRANLRGADLGGADLREADLRAANLREADLRGVQVTDEQLATTQSLQGAIMPDVSEHP